MNLSSGANILLLSSHHSTMSQFFLKTQKRRGNGIRMCPANQLCQLCQLQFQFQFVSLSVCGTTIIKIYFYIPKSH